MVVLTSVSLYILDSKNYRLLYLLPLTDIAGVSLSPYGDGFMIIHIRQVSRYALLSNLFMTIKILLLLLLLLLLFLA